MKRFVSSINSICRPAALLLRTMLPLILSVCIMYLLQITDAGLPERMLFCRLAPRFCEYILMSLTILVGGGAVAEAQCRASAAEKR